MEWIEFKGLMEKRRVCEGRVGWFWIAVAAKWWSLKATGRIVEARFFLFGEPGAGVHGFWC